jgi:diguanylate cyclase (GGDEF)-like protein
MNLTFIQNLSIRTKLILSLSLILFLAFSLTNIVNYHVSKHSLHDALLSDSLPLLSNNIYSQFQKDLMRPIHVASLMAHDTFVMDWISNGEQNIDEIQKYLLEIKDRFNFVSTFLISTKTRKYYFSKGLHKIISEKDSHDIWYYDFLKLDEDIDLDVDEDETRNNVLTIFINHRMIDQQGNVAGVIGVGLSLNKIVDLFTKYKVEYGRDLYLVDAKGVIQVHPDIDVMLKKNIYHLPGIQEFADDIISSKTSLSAFEFNRDGKHYVAASRYISEIKRYLIIEHDETKTLVTIKNNLVLNLFFGFFVTCAIILINIFTVNYFQSKLVLLATTDPLTGAFNRKVFLEKAHTEFNRSKRYKKPLSVLMLDMDYFKKINDTHGHMMGDIILKAVVDECSLNLRTPDVFARIGGEEFAAILVETNEEEAMMVSERLRKSIAELNVLDGQKPVGFTVSIGVTHLKSSDDNFEMLLQRADKALYAAKENGRNCVEKL